MIRSTTYSISAAITSLLPSTELPEPRNFRSGPKSAAWVVNEIPNEHCQSSASGYPQRSPPPAAGSGRCLHFGKCALMRGTEGSNLGFESCSLQRGVTCEPD